MSTRPWLLVSELVALERPGVSAEEAPLQNGRRRDSDQGCGDRQGPRGRGRPCLLTAGQGVRPGLVTSEGGLPASSAPPGDPLKCGEGSRRQNAELPGAHRVLTPRHGLASHLTCSFPFGRLLGS